MLDFIQKLNEELLFKLENLDADQSQRVPLTGQHLKLISGAIDQLKEKLKSYCFSDELEEIHFFKSSMPVLLSLFIYYSEKFEMESIQFVGTPKLKYEFQERSFARIEEFFKENAEFFRYWLSGETGLDTHYFLRRGCGIGEKRDLMASLMDPVFGTIYSIKVATFLAYTKLEQEIRQSLPGKENETATLNSIQSRLEWTDSKMGLIELIYSLKEQGAFNKGKADLKTITDCFESTFSISLGNTSKYFQEILRRKTGYTNYIDKLKEKLLGRIEGIEGGNIR